ncbi:flagellar biosynthesis anti-sigma factor FlgM [Legionella quateirensis]|uniref:Negative regulator of flagellin synthesis n=1 Tax=Legionella quateirensis TaxID=45072 RepID=A0A378KV79_9GAMM|nr:flagellar biosynthesis anti-sigma factor FlgM [Legionella quateirensis]KTD48141.1 flagellin synthesis negative regulator [Legionella quateirensis]STY18453.1 negative regulator of flagellin synthesis FlgM [Legionella quateirensis]
MLNVIEDICMVNHINDSANMKPIESDSRLKAKSQEAQHFAPDNNAVSIDNVNLSDTSRQLEALKASLQDVPEINEARVLYFKAEINSGSYQINSNNIAKNMFNTVEMA